MTRAPVIAISHGGGPMPLLDDPTHKEMIHSMRQRVPEILRLNTPEAPRAIVVVTAHWTEDRPTISSGSKHSLLYDYSGFPEEAYKLQYDAGGSTEVATEIEKVLRGKGLKPKMDSSRGWDHGVFVPMLLINPSANIPIIQISVLRNESPSEHFAMGQALASFRDSNIAILGSGFASFHNMRRFRSMDSLLIKQNEAWNNAVTSAMQTANESDRREQIEDWRNWPHSFEMHPKSGAEHFMPLLVCAGAGGDKAAKSYCDAFQGMKVWSYYWD